MRNWLNIDKVTIFQGKDKNGNRYLSQFLKDYQEEFHPTTINAGCTRCLEDYYLVMTKRLIKMGEKKERSGYVLKGKYNGIPLEFGSQIFVTNSNIDVKKAEFLIANHKKGKDLFEFIPEKKEAPIKRRATRKKVQDKE